MKDQIIKLYKEGKSYSEISKILKCSKSKISYYCGKGQKQKTKERTKKYKFENPIIVRIDAFNRAKSKKGLDNKITHFKTRGKRTKLSIKNVVEKFGTEAKCYLTGDTINFADPKSYSFDHIIPVSKGGDNSLENLGICTFEINMAKSDKTPDEFIELCKKVLKHNGYTIIKN